MLSFKEKIYNAVRKIPYGKVASYGQVALMIGIPRAARQVGWMLALLAPEQNVPWWRVVNNKGYLSIKNDEYSALEQKKRLESEGVEVNDDFVLDIKKYRYIQNPQELEELELDQETLDKLLKLF